MEFEELINGARVLQYAELECHGATYPALLMRSPAGVCFHLVCEQVAHYREQQCGTTHTHTEPAAFDLRYAPNLPFSGLKLVK